ncbi:MAG: rhomboid family intramembrane serine protease [Myxococcales bacterium]
MERWLTKLERRFGKYAPHNLILWLVGLSGLVYALSYASPGSLELLVLDPDAVARGEVWRLVTFLFLPWGGGGRGAFGPILTLVALMFLYTIGSSLEAEWGSFKFDVYYLVGVLATIAGAVLFGPVTNEFLNLSLLLAFAAVFPDYEILLFFILPVKMKWLGLFDGAFLLYQLATGSPNVRAGIVAAMLSWVLFCGGPLLARLRGRAATSSRRKRFEGFSPAPERRARVCAKCGRSDKDDPNLEFRVCDCQEKCHGRLTEYCIEHARAH